MFRGQLPPGSSLGSSELNRVGNVCTRKEIRSCLNADVMQQCRRSVVFSFIYFFLWGALS
jgi:hypothetical protein